MSAAELNEKTDQEFLRQRQAATSRSVATNPIRIAVIGAGYVGLVSGACFASKGIETTCVDLDIEKLAKLRRGETPIHEPGLSALLKKAIKRDTISFTDDIAAAVASADGVIIAVGTPTDHATGRADTTAVIAAATAIAPHLRPNAIVITKSTVPPGTNRRIAQAIHAAKPDLRFHTVSNPEFLREGQAIDDFINPSRIVIGVDAKVAERFMRDLYLSFPGIMHFVSVETAEIIKYASNAFLATKIAFINEIADLCEKVGADIKQVSHGMGLDPRIAPDFLRPGPGYGGSCFPKDTLALIAAGEDFAAPQSIVAAVARSNASRKDSLTARLRQALGHLKGRRIAVLGLAFKPGTDDVRDSPALDLIAGLQAEGAVVTAHDPEASDHVGFESITRMQDPMAAIEGTDAIVFLTDWPDYKRLRMDQALRLMRGNLIVDFRNFLDPEEMRGIGYAYLGVGLGTDLPRQPIAN